MAARTTSSKVEPCNVHRSLENMSQSNLDKVSEIFSEALQLVDRDPRMAERGERWSWDSLAHVILVGALESEFNVPIEVAVSLEIDSFPAAVRVLADLGVTFDPEAVG